LTGYFKLLPSIEKIAVLTVALTTGRRRVLAFKASVAPSKELE
jgi:hypothetical protein